MRTAETIRAEIRELERLAQKRRNKPGFSDNVAEIDERIADAKAELAELDQGES